MDDSRNYPGSSPDTEFGPDVELMPDLDSESGPSPSFYEETARQLFRLDPEHHLRLLGLPTSRPVQFVPVAAPESMTASELLVFRTMPGHLSHVEYVLDVPDDLEELMAQCRSVILQTYPGQELSQHVIVLRDGTFTSFTTVAS